MQAECGRQSVLLSSSSTSWGSCRKLAPSAGHIYPQLWGSRRDVRYDWLPDSTKRKPAACPLQGSHKPPLLPHGMEKKDKEPQDYDTTAFLLQLVPVRVNVTVCRWCQAQASLQTCSLSIKYFKAPCLSFHFSTRRRCAAG